MMGLLRYSGGLPHNRLERILSGLETPVPSSTQWDIVSSRIDALMPVFFELSLLGACGTVIFSKYLGIDVADWSGPHLRSVRRDVGEL